MKPTDEEDVCPVCGNPMRDDWHGLLACFCEWVGKQPTANEIITKADDAQAASHKN